MNRSLQIAALNSCLPQKELFLRWQNTETSVASMHPPPLTLLCATIAIPARLLTKNPHSSQVKI